MNSYILIGNRNSLMYTIDTINSCDDDLIYGILEIHTDKNKTKEVMDIPVLTQDKDKYLDLIGEKCKYFVCIEDNKIRASETNHVIKEYKHQPHNIIHPKAYISPFATIGYGNLIMGNAYIAPNAEIGNGNIILPNSAIHAGAKIGNFVSVSTGANIGSSAEVHDMTYVGSGVNIYSDMIIRENCSLAPGTVIYKEISSNCTVYGNPPIILKES